MINAEKIEIAQSRADQKEYISHTGYPGGQRIKTYKQMMETYPERIIETAVKGMLPKNSLGRRMNKKLKIYNGGEHPHSAQQPQTLELRYK